MLTSAIFKSTSFQKKKKKTEVTEIQKETILERNPAPYAGPQRNRGQVLNSLIDQSSYAVRQNMMSKGRFFIKSIIVIHFVFFSSIALGATFTVNTAVIISNSWQFLHLHVRERRQNCRQYNSCSSHPSGTA